jgi:hypothetical protein
MIWAIGPLLRRFWPVLAAVGFGLLWWWSWQRGMHQAEQRGYDKARGEMAAQVAQANAETAALEQRQRVQSQQAAQAWESKRNELQGQVNTLLARGVSVRVCKPVASASPLPGASPATASPDDAARGNVGAVQAGPDVGTQLVQLGAECERYRQQLKSLQDWIVDVK